MNFEGLIKKVLLIVCLSISAISYADEGMWIPSLLEHHNIDIMQGKGLKLTAEDIYSINKSSLTDGVVIFGRGCTGGIISGEGLVITNHHCGFASVQSLSSLENDYLKNGFWAMSRDEELTAPGLSVIFLIRIEDVTNSVLEGISSEESENWRRNKVNANIRRISDEAVKGTHYSATIKPFYYGNEYFMFIYEEFMDVRLVGAPPSYIGNFGADPDNWIWPRHTGDFSLFRIYADSDNKPAVYSPENVPYSSSKVLPISTAGYNENDFTMIIGFPGTTSQYIISPAIELIHKISLKQKIKLREKRLEIMDKYMVDSDLINLQYASKYRSVSNAWKKWKGVVRGMDRIEGTDIKRLQEEKFIAWINEDSLRRQEYGSILPEMYGLYDKLENYSLVYDYAQECIMAIEIFNLFFELGGMLTDNNNKSLRNKLRGKELFLNEMRGFFKDYHIPLDMEIFSSMLKYYYEDINNIFHPEVYSEIHGKYKGDYERFTTEFFKKSKFTSLEEIEELFSHYPENEDKIKAELIRDPLYKVYASFFGMYGRDVYAQYEIIYDEIERCYRKYVKGLMEMETDRNFYPDANFTMRLTYGKVEGYKPIDAVLYHYQTSIDGKFEKFRTGIPGYNLPDRLTELYNKKDYGRWADKDGNLYTCFIASNHTSGGNSGSPVMNGDGQILGINFDRNWEGTINDYIYDPLQCRNISVDIRYILFIIDKFAGAGYLIDEMVLVN